MCRSGLVGTLGLQLSKKGTLALPTHTRATAPLNVRVRLLNHCLGNGDVAVGEHTSLMGKMSFVLFTGTMQLRALSRMPAIYRRQYNPNGYSRLNIGPIQGFGTDLSSLYKSSLNMVNLKLVRGIEIRCIDVLTYMWW